MLLQAPLNRDMANLQQQIRSAEFKNALAQWRILGVPVGEKLADTHNLAFVQSEASQMIPDLRAAASRAGRDLLNVFLIPVLSFLMLKDGRLISSSLLDLVLGDESRANQAKRRAIVEGVLDDAHVLILKYMQALVVLCFAVLVVFSIALTTMRVRYALILALLAFPLEFIPLIGPVTAGVIIVGVCEFNHYGHMGWVLAFLVLYRIFQDYVLSPHLMNRSIQLHPLLIIFGVFAGGEIGGLGGVFLSVPLLAVLRLLFFEYRKRSIQARALIDVRSNPKTDVLTPLIFT
jgi:predicted PurR-regulated permease PerM